MSRSTGAFALLSLVASSACSFVGSAIPPSDPRPGRPFDPCGHYVAPVVDVTFAAGFLAIATAAVVWTIRHPVTEVMIPAQLTVGVPLVISGIYTASAVYGFDTDHNCLTQHSVER